VFLKAVLGSILLGMMIFMFPSLFGEGYGVIENLLKGNYNEILTNSILNFLPVTPVTLLTVALVIILIKVVATSLTLGAGGNGGIFAPSLFTGALTGFGTAFLVNSTGIASLHMANFIAVGMAGIMSGVVHAPLTAIFLIAEITGGYVLFVPLMIVSAISFFISRYFEPYSIYTRNLMQKGHLYSDDKDTNILQHLHLYEMIETEFTTIRETCSFEELIDAFRKSKRNVFPVVDQDDHFIGIIPLENIKEVMFSPELYKNLTVSEVCFPRCGDHSPG